MVRLCNNRQDALLYSHAAAVRFVPVLLLLPPIGAFASQPDESTQLFDAARAQGSQFLSTLNREKLRMLAGALGVKQFRKDKTVLAADILEAIKQGVQPSRPTLKRARHTVDVEVDLAGDSREEEDDTLS